MLLVIDDAELAIVAAAVRIGLVLDSELVLLAAARVGFVLDYEPVDAAPVVFALETVAALSVGLDVDSELVLLAAARVGFLEAAKLAEFLFLLD
jgi:hypothetical protein